jgi:hypothetical protein
VKRSGFVALAAVLVLGATPVPSAHQATVDEQSRHVMPFDLNRTMHVFTPTADGGQQVIMVHDGDARIIAEVRSHLRKEASAFAVGDYSDPAKIHGSDMPGLAQLQAGAKRITVMYSNRPDGGAIRYRTSDPKLIAALHRWFAAQVNDHGEHARAGH